LERVAGNPDEQGSKANVCSPLPDPPDTWWRGTTATAVQSAGLQHSIFITRLAAALQMAETLNHVYSQLQDHSLIQTWFVNIDEVGK
jgi:hypothetical protein